MELRVMSPDLPDPSLLAIRHVLDHRKKIYGGFSLTQKK